jgi:REP element-mobilizing transposase RayT
MDNHVHLMIKTNIEPLGKLMGRISASYTRYFNKKYNYIGHLFQGRYFSELIKSDEQMLKISRYVHLNPVRANMIDASLILNYFKYNNRVKLYLNFVESDLEFDLSLRNPS